MFRLWNRHRVDPEMMRLWYADRSSYKDYSSIFIYESPQCLDTDILSKRIPHLVGNRINLAYDTRARMRRIGALGCSHFE